MLDLAGTFKFVIIKPKGSKDYQRATYTFDEVLRLSHVEREFLRQARQEAYYDYSARLRTYVQLRDEGRQQSQLDRMIDQLKKKGHPTVWKEMQRYHRLNLLIQIDHDLDTLFQQAPEALDW